ncbi:DUF1097 domain-containing protein [Curtobacterium flaccumfaciens pv. flaccumfaciens]|uniref:DUF1097 domain-containing protein n=1 Tax=Curtobacterium flaccumfaciens TaxID=2035 RepID=UPI002658B695|nr:DUF1097 domain-containing protein [Curtobacterium flaccumfaciens]MCS5510809.1 DUF1097 domain-containing protein [Curtobacterium flaccumfaciens pv. flaccumfaciens]MCX2787108.1 DUF1097 domain-containing protein [Curtobacterium flaccumfaciens pv. flaccumfaciens]
MRERIPHEIVASVLAGATAFIGGNALHLPTWAIFISWAGMFLLGGKPTLRNATRLWAAMPIGSAFGLVIVLLDQRFGTLFGEGQAAQNTVLALLILVVNCALMYTGRTKLFGLVPGMFLGFASFFATCFGGFGFDPGNAWAAWVSVVLMNALGPVFAYLSRRLTFARPEPAGAVVEAGTVVEADAVVAAGGAVAPATVPAPERQPDQPVAASA